jgi:hypothetical protein
MHERFLQRFTQDLEVPRCHKLDVTSRLNPTMRVRMQVQQSRRASLEPDTLGTALPPTLCDDAWLSPCCFIHKAFDQLTCIRSK